MAGYYNNLTQDEQGKVLGEMAALKINASNKQITRSDVNAAFTRATGKALTQEYMRDPSVIQLMGVAASSAVGASAFSSRKSSAPGPRSSGTSITDRNISTMGLPVPKAPAPPPAGGTRYSAGAASGAKFNQ